MLTEAQNQDITMHREEKFSFMPRSLAEAEKYATIIASSTICPSQLRGKPGDILVIIMKGHRLGLTPDEAVQTIGCINGMPVAYGDGLKNLIVRHPDFVDDKEWFEGDLNLGTLVAHCTVMRKGREPKTRSFSIEDAKRAGLWGKAGPWQNYSKIMLQRRAYGMAAKALFPDALFGLMTQDEAESIPAEKVVPRPNSKGISGLKEALGINAESEVAEGEVSEMPMENPEPEIKTESHEAKVLECYNLLIANNVPEQSIAATLEKYGAPSIELLSEEILDKWIAHLKSKEQK